MLIQAQSPWCLLLEHTPIDEVNFEGRDLEGVNMILKFFSFLFHRFSI
jgi:hypothetical protein